MTRKTSSHKYLIRIGSIVAYWSVTELLCDQALAALLEVETDLARSVTRPGVAFDKRLDILKSVSVQRIKDEDILDEFHAVLAKLADAARERNKVVHSVWFNLGYEDLVDTAYSFERGEVPVIGSTKYRPEKLEGVLAQIRDATEALAGFLLERLGMPAVTPCIRIEGG